MNPKAITTSALIVAASVAVAWLLASMARTDRADRFLILIGGVLLGGLLVAALASRKGRRRRGGA